MKPNLQDIFSIVVSKMPFPEMFIENSEIKTLLFNEYKEVKILDIDASFQAYLKESGATKNNVREQAKKFYGNAVPDSCKIPDIKQTNIYRVLSTVYKCRKAFENKAIDKNSVIAQAVELSVQPIFRELDKIPGSCRRSVLPFVEFSGKDELRAGFRIKKTTNIQDSGACLTHYRDAAAAFNNALAGYDINDPKEGQPKENNDNTTIISILHAMSEKNVTLTPPSELENLISYGRTIESRIDIKGKYKDFHDVLYKYWGNIPRKYYSSWYDLIIENFTRNGKNISKSTISNPLNSTNWY